MERDTGHSGGGGGDVWVIAGLGNPGARYENTRHNAGFRALDEISRVTGIPVTRRKFRSLSGEGRYEGARLALLKPQTYMNDSGEALREAMRFYRAKPARLIVLYDDADIPVGSIRVRASGSAGTHNGMRSIVECLGGTAFPRVRVGIGAPPGRMDIKDYVLSPFRANEADEIEAAAREAAAAALSIATVGVDRAMNLHNPQRRPQRPNKPRPEAAEGGGDGDGEADKGADKGADA